MSITKAFQHLNSQCKGEWVPIPVGTEEAITLQIGSVAFPLELIICTCCGLQIRPVEEQLKQRVIGKRYCISRKRKSYKGSTSRARLAVRLSNVS